MEHITQAGRTPVLRTMRASAPLSEQIFSRRAPVAIRFKVV